MTDISDRNISQLVARTGEVPMPDDSPPGIDCRTLCSATTGNIKRDRIELGHHNDLTKRVFDPWPPEENKKTTKKTTDRDNWMIGACKKLTPEEEIVPAWAEESGGHASAKTAAFGDSAFRYGMQQICGCTYLFIASQKRVYIGHYWEDRSFGKLKNDKRPLQFAKQVINFLKNGYEAPNSGIQDSLTMHAADFKDDKNDSLDVRKKKLAAYIYSPKAEHDERNAGGLLYKDKVKEMAATVAAILDIDVQRVETRAYDAVDKEKDRKKENMLVNTAAGKLIFDYDPDCGDRKEPIGWRLIWQNQVIDVRQWAAPTT